MTTVNQLEEDSIWESVKRRHRGQTVRIRRAREYTVTVEAADKHGPRQHHDRRYTVPIEKFLRMHILITPAH